MTRQSTEAELLASRITQLVRKYDEANNVGAEASEVIRSISATCTELNALVSTPESWVERIALSYNGSAAICILLDLNIFHLLSKNGGRCALKEVVAQHILDEPSLELYKLNNRSGYLLDDNSASWAHYLADVGLQAAASLPQYVRDNRGQIVEGQHRSAFQIAFDTDEPFYQYLRSAHPLRSERFDKGLQRHVAGAAQTSIEDTFDFTCLKPGAVVVDIGGGRGQHSIRIARRHPQLSFIIQDYESAFPSKEDVNDEGVYRRLQWQQHDYFTEQPVKGADIYMLCNILMDNSASDCRRILEGIAEAMTPKKSVLLIDDGIELVNSHQFHSCYGSSMNMHMLAVLGTLFRTREQWEVLFSQIPGRLEVTGSWAVDGGRVIFELRRMA
ncbi:hypothetical protein N7447_000278 [Penicillium robsamsonii]|uniref:uncharacterized protein n=1 Tax=Penicillium robsamsonii TaxID=1792511 RepID=UPI002546D137|nr:uncharacterized protein N7447_000278 [Penicillium robsamsonii]KAJ5834252.1 hypothetical protein N7447_000278 [Penicillium robsamsonii]